VQTNTSNNKQKKAVHMRELSDGISNNRMRTRLFSSLEDEHQTIAATTSTTTTTSPQSSNLRTRERSNTLLPEEIRSLGLDLLRTRWNNSLRIENHSGYTRIDFIEEEEEEEDGDEDDENDEELEIREGRNGHLEHGERPSNRTHFIVIRNLNADDSNHGSFTLNDDDDDDENSRLEADIHAEGITVEGEYEEDDYDEEEEEEDDDDDIEEEQEDYDDDDDDDEEEEEDDNDENNEEEEEDDDPPTCYFSEEDEVEDEVEQYMEDLEEQEEFDDGEYGYMRNYILEEGFGLIGVKLYVNQLRLGLINYHEMLSTIDSESTLTESNSLNGDNDEEEVVSGDGDTTAAATAGEEQSWGEYSFVRNILRSFVRAFNKQKHLQSRHDYLSDSQCYKLGIKRAISQSSNSSLEYDSNTLEQSSSNPNNVSIWNESESDLTSFFNGGGVTIFSLMQCLPPLEELKEQIDNWNKLNHYRNLKETLMKKIIIDIYDKFLTLYEEAPHYHLQEHLIPIALKFYSNLSDETIEALHEKQTCELVRGLRGVEKEKILSLMVPAIRKQEILSYYKNKSRKFRNADGGLDHSKMLL
jgi:hypothetical protein